MGKSLDLQNHENQDFLTHHARSQVPSVDIRNMLWSYPKLARVPTIPVQMEQRGDYHTKEHQKL